MSEDSPPVDPVPAVVGDAPPTAKLVYLCLDGASAPLSVAMVADRVQSPRRSVRKAIADLQAVDVVEEIVDPSNPNTPQYRVTPDAPDNTDSKYQS